MKFDWSSSFESPMQELCQAIKPHSHDHEGMQTAVKAILYHSVDDENKEQHQYCQKGKGSCYKFQKGKANQTDITPGECGSDCKVPLS